MYPAPGVTRNTFKAVAVTIEDFTPGLKEPLSSIGLQVKQQHKTIKKAKQAMGSCEKIIFCFGSFSFCFW